MNAAVMNPAAQDATDRFGNAIDPAVYYARGAILRGNGDEVQRQRHCFAVVRERCKTHGIDSVYNLTGLIRGFRFRESDHEKLQSFVHFNALDDGLLTPLALKHMGGRAEEHDAFLCNRVSAAMLATMMALLKKGDLVISVVPAPGPSHPSIKNGVIAAGGQFIEVHGVDGLEESLGSGKKPRLIIATTITPSKRHQSDADLVRIIERAKRIGAIAMLDDAHMSTRLAVYEEQPGLALGADITVWSMDKHMNGPRAGMVAGRKEHVREIRAKAFVFGLEAQIGSVVATVNALEAYDDTPVSRSAGFAEQALKELQSAFKGRGYIAGPGFAISGDDMLEVAMLDRGVKKADIVPIEAIAVAAQTLLRETGGVTIPISAMPGSACVYRIMMYPDGERLGVKSIVDGTRSALSTLTKLLDDADAARTLILGESV